MSSSSPDPTTTFQTTLVWFPEEIHATDPSGALAVL